MVTQIAYIQGVDPPNLPYYVVVEIDTFIGSPWDHSATKGGLMVVTKRGR